MRDGLSLGTYTDWKNVLYETFVSTRYLKATRKSFLSTITLISALGVVLGVTALTAVVSVTGGFVKAYRERVLGVYPHIMLLPTSSYFPQYRDVMDAVDHVDGVDSVNAFVRQPLMLYTESARAMIVARGMSMDYLLSDASLQEYVVDGHLEDLEYDPYADENQVPGLFLGAELARILDAEVGTEVTAVSHLRGTGLALGPSQMAPTSMRFRVTGIFEVGYNDFDSHLALTDLRTLQAFINRGDVVTGVDVRVDDIFRTASIGEDITARLPAGAYQALGWEEIHKNLFRSLALQKHALSLFMVIIVIVASFNIVSTLVMMVLDKTKEIAILKSIGASRRGITRIFMTQGMVIGCAGTVLGLLSGFIVCLIIERIDFGLDPSVYKISSLPVDMRLHEFIFIAMISVCISLAATLVPSILAGRVKPVDGLRYD